MNLDLQRMREDGFGSDWTTKTFETMNIAERIAAGFLAATSTSTLVSD